MLLRLYNPGEGYITVGRYEPGFDYDGVPKPNFELTNALLAETQRKAGHPACPACHRYPTDNLLTGRGICPACGRTLVEPDHRPAERIEEQRGMGRGETNNGESEPRTLERARPSVGLALKEGRHALCQFPPRVSEARAGEEPAHAGGRPIASHRRGILSPLGPSRPEIQQRSRNTTGPLCCRPHGSAVMRTEGVRSSLVVTVL